MINGIPRISVCIVYETTPKIIHEHSDQVSILRYPYTNCLIASYRPFMTATIVPGDRFGGTISGITDPFNMAIMTIAYGTPLVTKI